MYYEDFSSTFDANKKNSTTVLRVEFSLPALPDFLHNITIFNKRTFLFGITISTIISRISFSGGSC